nr:hypothetical protein [Tanacetum cinerariifolium]
MEKEARSDQVNQEIGKIEFRIEYSRIDGQKMVPESMKWALWKSERDFCSVVEIFPVAAGAIADDVTRNCYCHQKFYGLFL